MMIEGCRARTGLTVAGLILSVLTIHTASAAGVTYSYDKFGRLTTALYDNGMCIAYTYDANGNRTAQTNFVTGPPAWGAGAWGCFVWTP